MKCPPAIYAVYVTAFLFEKIEVHSIEGKGKNRTQKIIIHYRFIGVIENPVKEENIVLESRQGVAVEYLGITKMSRLKTCSIHKNYILFNYEEI